MSLPQNARSSFNSLQTGKCIQRLKLVKYCWTLSSFNSLQTGKCIQSCKDLLHRTVGLYDLFQFPSNGKVYSEESLQANHLWAVEFQFPSNGKVYSEVVTQAPTERKAGFNSLQTGKCIQRRERNRGHPSTNRVSIPFKRESVFRVSDIFYSPRKDPNCVSIPFKRESVFRDLQR